MYAWSFAAARTRVHHDMREPPANPLMVQPPSDTCVPPPHPSPALCAAAACSVCRTADACVCLLRCARVQELGRGSHPALHVGACRLQLIRCHRVGGAPHATVGVSCPCVISARLTRPHARAQFDKRTYCGGQYAPGPRKMERIPEPPQWKEGLHLQARHARVRLRATLRRPCLADTARARTFFPAVVLSERRGHLHQRPGADAPGGEDIQRRGGHAVGAAKGAADWKRGAHTHTLMGSPRPSHVADTRAHAHAVRRRASRTAPLRRLLRCHRRRRRCWRTRCSER